MTMTVCPHGPMGFALVCDICRKEKIDETKWEDELVYINGSGIEKGYEPATEKHAERPKK